jgi:hypothetical protein
VIDVLKAGFYNEIDELKKLENDKKINILYCNYDQPLPVDRRELIALEDDFVLEIVVITNSIFFTSNKHLKDKAVSLDNGYLYSP